MHRSLTADGNHHYRTTRYNSLITHDDIQRNNLSKSLDQQLNIRSSKTKRSVDWRDDHSQINDGKI